MGNGRKKVVPRRQSNNSGIQRFNPVIGISTSQGSAQYEQKIQEVRRELERVIHGGTSKQIVVIGGDINAQIGRHIGAYDKSNTWEDMGSGEQTHKEKIKLNGSLSTDYVGLIHFSI